MNSLLQMMAVGSFIAERMREHGGGFDRLNELIDAYTDFREFGGAGGDTERFVRQRRGMLQWAVAWHGCGFPRVHLGHKHAAALMATKTKATSIPDAKAPWDTFMVDVPEGMIEWPVRLFRVSDPDAVVERRMASIRGVAVMVNASGVVLFTIDNNGDPCSTIVADSVGALGDFEDDKPPLVLCARLVLGVCMEMTSTTYKGGSLRPQPVKRDPRTGEPRTWTFQLTRDVKVDCRDAVRAYSQGRTHASPSVQCLVRGHWKQQACGKGGSERKNIFVEPYWRGPEDAHIALRKHAVSDPPAV